MARVNRRRGTKGNKEHTKKRLGAFATVMGVLFLIAWMPIHQKALHDTQNDNIGTKKEQPTAPSGSSLVECAVVTPEDAGIEDAANDILRITVRHDLSPLASRAFVDLVQAKHFDGVFIFRVLKGFIAQWGIRHKDQERIHMSIDKTRDEITDRTLSNRKGTLSFAGGNPHTKQVFVNLGDNRRLGKENSRPFATVDASSMGVLEKLYMGYKDAQGQAKALNKGSVTATEEFPRWSHIGACWCG